MDCPFVQGQDSSLRKERSSRNEQSLYRPPLERVGLTGGEKISIPEAAHRV